MELENIIRKTGRGIATLGLAAALTGAGCAARMSQGEQDVVVGEVLIQTEDPLLVKMGSILYTLGLIETQKEVARESRTQINVNTRQPQREIPRNVNYNNGKYGPKNGYAWVNPEDSEDLRVKKIIGSGFAFKWIDYNHSGNVDNLNEYIERKNRFKSNEGIALALLYEAEKPFRQNLKIYSPEGKIMIENDIDPFQKKISYKKYLYYENNQLAHVREGLSEWTKKWMEGSNRGASFGLNNNLVNWLLMMKAGGEGEYSAVWRVNGRIKDSITFDIIY